MADPIAFYFDFSSPYGYLASTRIDALAEKHGRMVTWRPFLLGVAFKTTGQLPLVEQPLRGPCSLRDFARSARCWACASSCRSHSRSCRWRPAAPSTGWPTAMQRRPRRWRERVYHAAFGLGRDMRAARGGGGAWRSRSASNARPCSRPSTTRP